MAHSPDSYSFQHFLDRITHILAQASHLTLGESDLRALTGSVGNRFVKQMWNRLGFADDHVLHKHWGTLSADRFFFSCRAVLIHPWLSLRALENLGTNHAIPSATRKTVVYMTRSNGRTTNGGRRVVNEDALLASVRELLERRGKGESLVVFDQDKFADIQDLFDFFASNVSAIVGPHGGAMHHHRWAAKGTLVIEMMRTTFTSMAIYEEASVLSQNYAAIVTEPAKGTRNDMEIEVDDVIGLLDKHLGQFEQDPLEPNYPWKAKELWD